jgi:hypothetical protein
MADLLVTVSLLAFFALCVALVRGCDRIIGPDAFDAVDGDDESAPEPAVVSR